MNASCTIICVIIATIMSIVLIYKCKSESFDTTQQQVQTCLRWDGNPEMIDNKMYCRMPPIVQNTNKLNFQLAGKLCDLEYLHETLGCRSIEGATNPYNSNASRGYYSWYR